MPIYYVTRDRDGTEESNLVPYGSCSRCRRGEPPHGALVLYAADRDGEAPWVCEDCFAQIHDTDPDPTDPQDCGLNVDILISDPRLFASEQEGHDWYAAGMIDNGEEGNDMPGTTQASLANLRADRVVESYDFDNDYRPSAPRLMLPPLADREDRLISVEQEIGKGREYMAETFYSNGFSLNNYANSYHSGDDGGFCRVEDDSSVNGEIIYGRLRLSDPGVAQRFEDALCLVRDAISDNEVKLDMRCGLHVHVDARGLGMEAITNLYNLWNHVEDTVYRLAAANWRCHRTAVAHHDYAPPTMKGLEGHASIGTHFQGTRGALNLSNYLESRSRCRCGAFAYASWEDCTCDLPKATVEFRVFNATANLRKIHAYTALSVALVEASRRLRFTPDDFPAFGFDRGAVEVANTDATKKALEVIFGGMLPLTDTEREDLAYCARNSAVGEVYATM